MPDPSITDVIDITANPTLKAQLLADFQETYTPGTLYRKAGDAYVAMPSSGDQLINTGYFLTKQTLTTLLGHVGTDNGGVWVQFGLGTTEGRGTELQLVITATDADAELANDDTGTYCATTHNEGDTTDPPYTGDPSPRGRG